MRPRFLARNGSAAWGHTLKASLWTYASVSPNLIRASGCNSNACPRIILFHSKLRHWVISLTVRSLLTCSASSRDGHIVSADKALRGFQTEMGFHKAWSLNCIINGSVLRSPRPAGYELWRNCNHEVWSDLKIGRKPSGSFPESITNGSVQPGVVIYSMY